MTMASDTIIEFQDVCFAYNESEILHNVSFSVQKNDFVAIVGPNGGGKTTIIQLALGIIQPTRGKVHLIGDSPIKMRHRVGYVPQSLHFDPTFPVSVRDVVRMGRVDRIRWGMYRKRDDRAVAHALARTEALDLMDHAFSELSGGERQRVLLSQALVGEPDVLMLDEPTANVDAGVEQRLYDLFRHLGDSMTIVLVSHNLNVVTRHANRVLCVNRTAEIHSIDAITSSPLQSAEGTDLTVLFHTHHCPVTDSSRFLSIDHRAEPDESRS